MTRHGVARQALMTAALDLTYRNGINATGVDAIALQAGVTKRTLYAHFPSKDELIAAALTDVDQSYIDQLHAATERRAAKTGEPAVLALFDVVERILAGPDGAGCRFLNAALEIGSADHPVAVAARRHLRNREQLVTELLATGGHTSPELAAQVILLVDGVFTVGATRAGSAAAKSGKLAAATLIAHNAAAHG